MKGKASDICTKCKHCECFDMFAKMYSCKHYNNYPDAAIGKDSEIECYNFEEVNMNKVEGKVAEFCPKCKNCKGVVNEYDGNDFVVITGVECEDPYDGMVKTLDADSDICYSRFEVKEDKLMQYYREKSKNYEQILIDISRFVPVEVTDFKDLPKIIEQMRKTGDMYEYWEERCHNAETDVTTLNSKVDVLEKKLNRAESIRSEILTDWNHTMEFHDELKSKIDDLTESNETLKKMVERRDKWVDELKIDIHTLQNEILNIRDVAQKAYDDTNRD